MKIVCAPDSFKETLTAAEAADSMAGGILDADPAIRIDVCPVGDGGEGTMDALLSAGGGQRHRRSVTGSLGEPVTAAFGMTPDNVGIVELAQASGLALVPADRRDPTRTTTYGTGELIRAAADAGAGRVIICIGGSATCDGAAGLAQALGVRFFDASGNLITAPLTGGTLTSIAGIDTDVDLPELRIACDVTNPLLGERGAAAVYGPQKGATPQQVGQLDQALAHLASLTDVQQDFHGAGAAGGAGFGLVALCGATLQRGIDLVLETVGFRSRCAGADLVLTGEGQLDAQSLSGKAAIGVAQAAQQLGIPAIAIVGSLGPGAQSCLASHDPPGPLRAVHALADRFGTERARRQAAALVREVTHDVVTAFRSGGPNHLSKP